jgi:hypothetical protein
MDMDMSASAPDADVVVVVAGIAPGMGWRGRARGAVLGVVTGSGSSGFEGG